MKEGIVLRLISPLTAIATVLACATFAASPLPNLVQNPGFEQVTAAGLPEHWGGPPSVYTVVNEPVHSGSNALQFVNMDAGNYALCSQDLPLEPGTAYQASVWVRTENIQGEDNGATLCLEWYAADGKYLGGSYPAGFKGTNDWQQVRCGPVRVPPGAAKCSVTCYVRKGMIGKAWWDDVVVTKDRFPAMTTMLRRPNYRGELYPGATDVKVFVKPNLRDWELGPEQVVLRMDVTPEDADLPVLTEDFPVQAEGWEVTLDGASLPAGKHSLWVALLDAETGEVLASDTWRLQMLAENPNPSRRAYIDEHARLIFDGKPFFPLGMYFGGVSEADLDVYADSAFNCLMPYGAPNGKGLEWIDARGLKVIYSIKDVYFGSAYCPQGIETTADERRFIEETAAAVRDHPAVLAWYLNDELPLDYIDRLEAHQQWIEELDPDHPTWVVLWQVGQVDRYVRTFDAIGTDPYPIPDQPPSRAASYTRQTVDGAGGTRAVWMVPQVFNWAVYGSDEEKKKTQRPPTFAEMRSMAWQCIAEGAKGLVFYSFFDIKRDKRVPFEEQWGYCKQMAAEIDEMIPAILSVEDPAPIAVEKADWLNWTSRKLEGVTYLIAVNNEDAAHTATFQLPAGVKQITLRGSEEAVTMGDGGALSVDFPPLDVRIYELRF